MKEIVTGLNEIEKKTQEVQSMSDGNWIRNIKLKGGEFATIRFMTDADGVISAPYHSVKKVSPKGPYFTKEYCELNDKGVCAKCAIGENTIEQLSLWAWVYKIIHNTQNPAVQSDPNAEKWTAVKVNGVTKYQQDVNAPMWFLTGIGHKGSVKRTLIQFAKDYNGLLTQDYKWSRSGDAWQDTVYTLSPSPKGMTQIPDEVKDAMETLPDLGDVVRGKIRAFDNGNSQDGDGVSDAGTSIEELDDLF